MKEKRALKERETHFADQMCTIASKRNDQENSATSQIKIDIKSVQFFFFKDRAPPPPPPRVIGYKF